MTAPTLDKYTEFLTDKVRFRHDVGVTVEPGAISPVLFSHQADVVRWAVQGGRRAIFAAFGLGKTPMQLETVRLTQAHAGGAALIVCPLGVRDEFRSGGDMLGVETRFVRHTAEVTDPSGIYIANYESVRDGRLDPELFTTVSLDEASVLRSYGSKTHTLFTEMFRDTPYKFVATATPSPNRHKELIHYADFLGVMDGGQALTRWFERDSLKAGNLKLHPHKEDEFWLWVSTWAVFLQRPSDLGYPDDGYDLPDMTVHRHEVAVDHGSNVVVERDGQARLYRGDALGVTGAAKEKRLTLAERVAKAMDIVDGYLAALKRTRSPLVGKTRGNHMDQIVIWCDLNDEQHALERALKAKGLTFSSVHGSLTVEETERRLAEWKDKRTYALIGKPVMLGQGLNLQQCNKAIFVGITHKFNQFIQAIHRIQRFGQTRPVETHIIYAESEREVLATLDTKWDEHRKLTTVMSKLIRKHGLNQASIDEALKRSLGVERVEVSGEGWVYVNNDCVAETAAMADNSVDLIVTSIPFSNHYEYTPSLNDFGHTDDNDHFWRQMDFLTPQLLRILAPGRIYCCHVKDRVIPNSQSGDGMYTSSMFHAEAMLHGRQHGFNFLGMITVETDVVTENKQSNRLGWSENAKDSTKMGVGSPEYILIFRKTQSDTTRAYADVPVSKSKTDYTRARWQLDAHAKWRSSPDRHLTADELLALPSAAQKRLWDEYSLNTIYDYESHVRISEAVDAIGKLPAHFMLLAPRSKHPDIWDDVIRMHTANTAQAQAGREKHICPLQFDIVDRLINRYSNRGELVFDPFGGLGTVPVRAIKLGRRGRGVELNPGYFLDAVKFLQVEERKAGMPRLFDLDGVSA